MNNKPLVINLFGAPGVGKSTGAAYIFSKLKMSGINVELVTEFAKDKVWEDNENALTNQSYVFGNQSYRMSRCAEKVDVIVTDSPLPLSILYNDDKRLTENFNKAVMDVFNSYNNINYVLYREKPYSNVGRIQSENEADLLADKIRMLLRDRNISYKVVSGDRGGYESVLSDVYSQINII